MLDKDAFIARTERYRAKAGRNGAELAEVTLSKKLFDDAQGFERLRRGKMLVSKYEDGIRRFLELERALAAKSETPDGNQEPAVKGGSTDESSETPAAQE